MLTNTEDGRTMYILRRREVGDLNISKLNNRDCIVIVHKCDERCDSDYFIHVDGSKTYVTKRCSLVPLEAYRQPDYIRTLIHHIRLTLKDD